MPTQNSNSNNDNISSAISTRHFSSFSPIDWWRDRQEGKNAEKYKERLKEMSEKKFWSVGDMLVELQEVKSSWMAKIPGLNSGKEIQMGKEMLRHLEGVASVMGADCPADTLKNMTTKQKLQCAVAGQTSVASIDAIIQQMNMMSLMHRIVRKRHVEGKVIPTTSDALQVLMQTEGVKLMSKEERRELAMKQSNHITKGLNMKQRGKK